jgi:cytochrome c556
MLRVFAGLAALAVCTTWVMAQNAKVIEQRQQTMKAIAGALKEPTAMVKGEMPLDLAKVQAALKAVQEGAVKAKTLFTEDSQKGETDALPEAFSKHPDVTARLDKMAADANAATTAIKDEGTLKTEWPKVVSNCGGCHKLYRKPSS